MKLHRANLTGRKPNNELPDLPDADKNNQMALQPVLSRMVETRSKWGLRACPKCGGDVFLEMDEGETLGHCLQCGYLAVRYQAPPPFQDSGV